MAKTVKDLLSLKKISYQELIFETGGRRSSAFHRGPESVGEMMEQISIQLMKTSRTDRLLSEIQYLEARLDNSFESVSFMANETEIRQLECMD
ncbi:hypothetical protein D9M68_17780 [compost metagenome]